MRENCTHGSEGGEAKAFPTPIGGFAKGLAQNENSWRSMVLATTLCPLSLDRMREHPLTVPFQRLTLKAAVTAIVTSVFHIHGFAQQGIDSRTK